MKRFEKNDLFKITGLMVLLTAVLTWLIPYGYFSGGELVADEITRIGIFDFFTYGLLGLYYFTVLVTFLLVLCGFYQVLSRIPAYQRMTSTIAKKLKGKEIIFATVTSLVVAVITAFVNEYFIVIAFLPFIITICSKLKMDKLSTFATTFGGLLVGIMGSLYNVKVVGVVVSNLGITYSDNLVARIILLAITYLVFTLFNILYMKKQTNNKISKTIIAVLIAVISITILAIASILDNTLLYIIFAIIILLSIVPYVVLVIIAKYVKHISDMLENKKKKTASKKDTKIVNLEVAEDLFVAEVDTKNKKSSIPLIIVLAVTAIIALLAYVGWETVFELTWPTDALTWITEVTIFDHPVFSYILGNVQAFGSWDIFGIQVLLLVATLILKVIYSISFDEILESFGEGFKKSGKLIVIMLLAYIVLEFSVMFPILPTISNWFLNLTDSFNVFTTYIVGLINSLFTVEFSYTASLIGTQLATIYADSLNVIAVIMQSTYGLISFVAPTSAILLIGLSYLDIKYKSWLKYIWKFLVAMLVVTIVMALIIA